MTDNGSEAITIPETVVLEDGREFVIGKRLRALQPGYFQIVEDGIHRLLGKRVLRLQFVHFRVYNQAEKDYEHLLRKNRQREDWLIGGLFILLLAWVFVDPIPVSRFFNTEMNFHISVGHIFFLYVIFMVVMMFWLSKAHKKARNAMMHRQAAIVKQEHPHIDIDEIRDCVILRSHID